MLRTFDADRVNAICALPGMPVWCGTLDKPVDLSPAVLDPRNWFFVSDAGFFAAVWRGGGLYEIHMAFSPQQRGLSAIRALRAPMNEMFRGPADAMVAEIPESNRACRHIAVRFGFERIAGTLGQWDGEDLIPYAISKLMWFRSRECLQSQ